MRLLIFVMLTGCGSSTNIMNIKQNFNIESELIDYLLIYGNMNEIDANKLIFLLENNQKKIPLKDYYYYKVMINTILGKNSNVDLLTNSDKLGNMYAGEYIYDFYFKDDFKKRVKYLESSATKGNSSAQFILGIIYYYGRTNFKINKDKGLILLEKSAMQGLSSAIQTLGELKFKKNLKKDKYDFWNIIYIIYEKEINLDVNKWFKEINNKPQFCDRLKQFVYNNEIKRNIYRDRKFNYSLQLLSKCLRV